MIEKSFTETSMEDEESHQDLEHSSQSSNSNYSSYSTRQQYHKRYVKNTDFIMGFLSGVFFNIFSLTILFFVKSKNFEEGVKVGWVYFILFASLFLLELLLETFFKGKFN